MTTKSSLEIEYDNNGRISHIYEGSANYWGPEINSLETALAQSFKDGTPIDLFDDHWTTNGSQINHAALINFQAWNRSHNL